MLVVAVSAFLPWVSVFGIGVTGIRGDGVLTLVLALIGIVLLALTTGVVGSTRTPSRWSQISLLVLAAVVALVGLMDMNGMAAMGLYLTLLSGLAWVVGAVWQLNMTKQAQPAGEAGNESQV